MILIQHLRCALHGVPVYVCVRVCVCVCVCVCVYATKRKSSRVPPTRTLTHTIHLFNRSFGISRGGLSPTLPPPLPPIPTSLCGCLRRLTRCASCTLRRNSISATVCVCVRARACVRACVRACMRTCLCVVVCLCVYV